MNNAYSFNSYQSDLITQLRWLLWRNGLSIIRDKSNNMILLIQCIFMGLIYFRDNKYSSKSKVLKIHNNKDILNH